MPGITNREYDHADAELQIDGVSYPFESIKYSSPREVGEGFGNSRMPAYQTDGRVKFEGELKVRKHVWYAIREQLIAAYGYVYKAIPEITVSRGKDDDQMVDTLVECKLMDVQEESSEGIDAAMVTCPLKPWRIKYDGVLPYPEEGQG